MIAAIRRSQDLSRAGLPFVARHVFVPLSWLLTALALRFGIAPNTVTWMRAGLMLASVCAIPFTLWGLVPYVVAVILDHVDGSLCRINDTATWYGKFLDGMADLAGDLLLLPALGLYALLNDGSTWAPAVGAFATAFLGLAFLAIYRLPLIELQAKAVMPPIPGLLLNAVFDLRYLGMVPLLLFGAEALVAFLAALYFAASPLIVIVRVCRAKAGLDFHRKSKSSR